MQRVQTLLGSEKPLVHLFYGDSITHGISATHLYRDYTQHYAEYIRGGGIARALDAVINTAISGNSTKDLLHSFADRAQKFRPDLAYLMIGMNDCSKKRPPERQVSLDEFRLNLRELTRRFREMGTLVVLQTTCPVIPGSGPEDREFTLPAYMEAIRELASEENLPLVDHHAHWLARPAFPYNWMQDSFHPNEWGHLAFARYLLEQLGIQNESKDLFKVPLR